MNFKLKSLFSVGLLGLLMAVAQVAHANDTTFNVNETIGANSVTGTITTVAGVAGALTSADIVSTDLTFDGTTTIDDTTGAYVNLTGDDLTETATALYFNFADSAVGDFDPDFNSGTSYTWFNVTVGGNSKYAPAGLQGIETPSTGLSSQGASGNIAIATTGTSVPEPNSSVLTLTGLVILGLMRKRIVPALG